MSWVWLSPPRLDFGEAPAGDGAELTVWLHADPYKLLQIAADSDEAAVRRSYRRAARHLHPDTGANTADFEELQRALSAALGSKDAEVTVEPTAGSWWTFTGFVSPAPDRQPGRGAVAGLVFEITDIRSVPLRVSDEVVRVSYNGQAAPLALTYNRSSRAFPVLRAKAAALMESAFLVFLCLLLIPFLALGLSLESYFFAGGSALLFWAVMLLTIGAGYGALVVALATAGKPVPYPRRAIRGFRGRRTSPRVLTRGPR